MHHIVRKFCRPCPITTAELWTVPVPSVLSALSKTIKGRLNALAVLGLCLFLLALILPGRRRTFSERICLAGVAAGVITSRRYFNESSCGPSLGGSCMPSEMSCTSSAQLSPNIPLLHGFVKSLSQHGHRLPAIRLSVAYRSSDSAKKLLLARFVCVIASNASSVVTVFGA